MLFQFDYFFSFSSSFPRRANGDRAMSIYVEAPLWRYMMDKSNEDYEEAFQRLQIAASQAEAVYSSNSNWMSKQKDVNKMKLLCEGAAFQGNAFQMLGLVLCMNGNYVKGTYYTRRAWKHWVRG